MIQDWHWQSWKRDGLESALAASDARYDRLLEIRAYAVVRKTTDGEYFWRFLGTRDEEDPVFYPSLERCQEDCEEKLKIRQVVEKLDHR